MNDPFHDVRGAVRALRRAPGFNALAILTLGLGIGLATAVFTVAEAVLLRPLPVHDQDRIVVLWGEMRDGSFDNHPLGLADAREFALRTGALERAALFGYEGAAPMTIREGDQVTRLNRAVVSGAFFDVLGARPVLGRTIVPDDDHVGAAPVAVLSHGAWQGRYGGAADIVGRRIVRHDDGAAYTVVGVMPQGFQYPRGTDLWIPVATSAQEETLALLAFHVIGRLAGGAAPTDARDELASFYGRSDASPWQRELRAVVHTLPRLVLGETRPALIAFGAASALLLLITCINVANLLIVRGAARAREIAVRSALGAGRWRVIAQLLTESTILAALGGVVGLGVAAAAVRTFTAFAPAGVPRLDEVHLDATPLAGAVAITGTALLLFALAPAVMTARVELRHMLGSGTRHGTGRRSRRASEVLVAGQVALALLVLAAAGLIARSLVALERADLAFEPSNLLIAELALPREQFDDAESQRALLEQLVPELRGIPGVSAVSPIVAVPFSGSRGWDGRPSAEGQSPEQAAENPMLNMEVVTPDYFEALDVPVLHGRTFTDADRAGGPAVIMVSESVARYFWPGSDAIGRQLRLGPTGPGLAIIGVVPDTRYRELRDARPTIYFPLRQSFFPFAPTTLAIRSSAPTAVTVAALRRTIAESAPGVAVASAAPFDAYLAGALAHPRLNALLLAVFAAAAVVLAAVGLFALLMTMVRQRRHEFGVRLALGATGRDLLSMVVLHALAIASVGALAGLAGAVIANRLLVALLYDVSPTDLATLAGVTAILLAVAALASLAPAWSSARVDPAAVLRT